MELDLSGSVDGVPERFVPEIMAGSLVDADHRARYWWVSGLARGRRVLDAGCGLAYGTKILAEAGASEVIGIDRAEAVVEAARARVPAGVRIERGDVAKFSFGQGSFDLVVCFEVIEHVEDPDVVFDELARVLRPGGVLAISSPNRRTYPPGNPHHVHEFEPDELRQALEARFSHVRTFMQHDFVTSAILGGDAFRSDAGAKLVGVETRKVVAGQPGEEAYTLVLAGDEPITDPLPIAVLTRTLELREWLGHFEAQQRAFEAQENQLAELEVIAAERSTLVARLEEAERNASDRLDLMESLTHAESLLSAGRQQLAEAEAARVEARRALDNVVNSLSWKFTAPLRAVKRLSARNPPAAQ